MNNQFNEAFMPAIYSLQFKFLNIVLVHLILLTGCASTSGFKNVVKADNLERTQSLSSCGSNNTENLFNAVQYENPVKVNLLIQQGANVNCVNNNGATPLLIATSFGHVETTKVLVNEGASVNEINSKGLTPLINIVHSRNLAVVKLLLNKGALINAISLEGDTALIKAIQGGSYSIVKYLIKNGADVKITQNDGRSALYYAVKRGSLNMVELLIKSGANVNLHSNIVDSPLHLARVNGDTEIVKILSQHHAIAKSAVYKKTDIEDEQSRLKLAKPILVKLGYAVNLNDEYDGNTRSAIRNFQKVHGLQVSGESNKKLLTYLTDLNRINQNMAKIKHAPKQDKIIIPSNELTSNSTLPQKIAGISKNYSDISKKVTLCKTFIGLNENGKIKQVGNCPSRSGAYLIKRHLKHVAQKRKLLQAGEYEIVETKI